MTAVSEQEQYFIVWLDFEGIICSWYVHMGLKSAVVYFNWKAFDVRYEKSSVFEWRTSLPTELWYTTDYIAESKSLFYLTCIRKKIGLYTELSTELGRRNPYAINQNDTVDSMRGL